MWLTIWRDHIDNCINNNIDTEYICEETMPKNSTKYTYSRADSYSPCKKRKHNKARKKLSKMLEDEQTFGEKQKCVLDETQPAQYCLTHNCSALDCWVFEPMDEEEENALTIDTQHTPVSIAYSSTHSVIVVSDDETSVKKKKLLDRHGYKK